MKLSRDDINSWTGEQRKRAMAEGAGGGDSEDAIVLLDASKRGLDDISVLSHYRALERLDLSHNKLCGLGKVAKLGTRLRSLSFAHNPLVSADGVERLKRLTKLDLSDCGLASLPPLGGLSGLTTLLLGGNALTAMPVVVKAGTGSGELEAGLRELQIDRNQLTSVPVDWMAFSARQLRVLELGAKYVAQIKNQRNKRWEATGSSGNPLPAEVVTALLSVVAGCCQHLEILSIPSAGVGAGGRLSREERKKRAEAKKKGLTVEGGGDFNPIMVLHALPRLKKMNGYNWVRNLDVVASAEAAVEAHAAVATGQPDEANGAKEKHPREETEVEVEARKKRKKAKKKAKKEAEEAAVAAAAVDKKAKKKKRNQSKQEKQAKKEENKRQKH